MHREKLKLFVPNKFLPLYQNYRHKAFHGGRGGTKSHTIGEYVVVKMMSAEERVVGCRQFQNSIRESSKALVEAKIQKLGVSKAFRILDREIVHVTTDSRMTFLGLERNVESVKSLEGATISWAEEARVIKQESLDIIIPTIRAPGAEMLWSWNPKFRSDPVDSYFRGPIPPPRSVVVEVGHEDNPYFYQTEMPAEKEHMLKLSKQKHDYIWGGGYDEVGEARIFQNTRVGRVPVPDHCVPLFGLDFGFANDPTALTKLYIIEEAKQIYIAQEAFGYNVSLVDLPDLLKTVTESTQFPITADSSRPETIDYLNGLGHGFNVVSSRKGPGSIKAGIEWIQGFEVIIDPDCVHMQDEAVSYSWKVDERTQKILPIPVDTDNHGWDSVRYASEEYRNNGKAGTVSRGHS